MLYSLITPKLSLFLTSFPFVAAFSTSPQVSHVPIHWRTVIATKNAAILLTKDKPPIIQGDLPRRKGKENTQNPFPHKAILYEYSLG